MATVQSSGKADEQASDYSLGFDGDQVPPSPKRNSQPPVTASAVETPSGSQKEPPQMLPQPAIPFAIPLQSSAYQLLPILGVVPIFQLIPPPMQPISVNNWAVQNGQSGQVQKAAPKYFHKYMLKMGRRLEFTRRQKKLARFARRLDEQEKCGKRNVTRTRQPCSIGLDRKGLIETGGLQKLHFALPNVSVDINETGPGFTLCYRPGASDSDGEIQKTHFPFRIVRTQHSDGGTDVWFKIPRCYSTTSEKSEEERSDGTQERVKSDSPKNEEVEQDAEPVQEQRMPEVFEDGNAQPLVVFEQLNVLESYKPAIHVNEMSQDMGAQDDTLEAVQANEAATHPAQVAPNADVQKTISKKSVGRANRKKKQEERKAGIVQIPEITNTQQALQTTTLPQAPSANMCTENQSTQIVPSSSKPMKVAEEESAKNYAKNNKKDAKKPVEKDAREDNKKTAKKKNDGSVVSSDEAEAENSKLITSEPVVTDNVPSVGSDTVEASVVCTTDVKVAKPLPVDVTAQESTTTNAVSEELESTDDLSRKQAAEAGNRLTDDKAVVPVELSKSQKKKFERKQSAVQPKKPGELSKAYSAVPPVIDVQNIQEKPTYSTSSDANVPSTLRELEQNVFGQSNGSMLQRAVLPPLPALSVNKTNGSGTDEDGGRASDVPDAKRNEVAGILFNIKLQEKIKIHAELVAERWPRLYENANDDDLVFGGMCMSYCHEMDRLRVPIAVFHIQTAFNSSFNTKNPTQLDLLKNIVIFNMNKPISGLFNNDLYDDFVTQRIKKYYCRFETDREARNLVLFFKAMYLFKNKKYFIQDINYLSSLGGDDDEKSRLDELYFTYFSAAVTSQCVYDLDYRYPNITDVSAELIELIGETDCKILLKYLGLQYRIRYFNRSEDERNKENADLCTPRQHGMLKFAEESKQIESNWAPKDTEEFFVKCLESASSLDRTPEVQHIINRYKFLIQVQSLILDVDVFNYMRKFKFDPATFDIKKHRFILDPWFTSK